MARLLSSEYPKTFDAFINSLRDSGERAGQLSPAAYIRAIGTDVQTFAQEARVHRNTVTRSPGSEPVQKYIRDSLRVLKAATDLAGDVDQAVFWFNNDPLSVFGYKTARELVAEGRIDPLLHYVQSLDAGAAG